MLSTEGGGLEGRGGGGGGEGDVMSGVGWGTGDIREMFQLRS